MIAISVSIERGEDVACMVTGYAFGGDRATPTLDHCARRWRCHRL